MTRRRSWYPPDWSVGRWPIVRRTVETILGLVLLLLSAFVFGASAAGCKGLWLLRVAVAAKRAAVAVAGGRAAYRGALAAVGAVTTVVRAGQKPASIRESAGARAKPEPGPGAPATEKERTALRKTRLRIMGNVPPDYWPRGIYVDPDDPSLTVGEAWARVDELLLAEAQTETDREAEDVREDAETTTEQSSGFSRRRGSRLVRRLEPRR